VGGLGGLASGAEKRAHVESIRWNILAGPRAKPAAYGRSAEETRAIGLGEGASKFEKEIETRLNPFLEPLVPALAYPN
jgi:hypothetical protein